MLQISRMWPIILVIAIGLINEAKCVPKLTCDCILVANSLPSGSPTPTPIPQHDIRLDMFAKNIDQLCDINPKCIPVGPDAYMNATLFDKIVSKSRCSLAANLYVTFMTRPDYPLNCPIEKDPTYLMSVGKYVCDRLGEDYFGRIDFFFKYSYSDETKKEYYNSTVRAPTGQAKNDGYLDVDCRTVPLYPVNSKDTNCIHHQ